MVSYSKCYVLLSVFWTIFYFGCGSGVFQSNENKNKPFRINSTILKTALQDSTQQTKSPSESNIPGFLKKSNKFCENCTLSISDPEMDSANAMEQALQRAGILSSLSDFTDIKFVSDLYQKENGKNKSEIFAHLFEIYTTVKPMKVDTAFFSKYDEAIILARPKGCETDDDDQITITGFIQEKAYGDQADYLFRFEMKTVTKSLFLLRIVNDDYYVESIRKSVDSMPYPKRIYNYATNISNDTDYTHAGFSLNSGLWPAYIGGVLNSVFYKSKETAEYEVGSMNDAYSQKMRVGLIREIGVNTFSVNVCGCEVYDNRLTPHTKLRFKN